MSSNGCSSKKDLLYFIIFISTTRLLQKSAVENSCVSYIFKNNNINIIDRFFLKMPNQPYRLICLSFKMLKNTHCASAWCLNCEKVILFSSFLLIFFLEDGIPNSSVLIMIIAWKKNRIKLPIRYF